MDARSTSYMSEDAYIERERASETRHEYYAGVIYAMTGASEQHNLIAVNIVAALHAQLRGGACRVYPGDMRIKVVKTGLNTYPDLTIVCGPSQFADPRRRDTLTNPTVIVEILSPSTERYDRGIKFQHYRTIETLQEYLLVAQDAQRIERFARQRDQLWVLSEAVGPGAELALLAVPATLRLDEVYEQVELPAEPPTALPLDLPREE